MKKKILVVEDSPGLAKMISAVIRHGNYEPEHALHGEEALSMLKKNAYDLIVLDLMMPIMDGKEFLLKINETNNDIPVLVYTGSQGPDMEQELIDAGADKITFKPMGAQKLLDSINELLN